MNLFSSYETYLQKLSVAHLQLNLLRIKDVDSLYDDLIKKGESHEDVKDERIPYWAELWPSALALAEYIVASGIEWKDKKILEIGCGFAVPGIVAGMLGADVTLTDYLPEPLEFAKYNWEQNVGIPAKVKLLDWRNPSLVEAADIVLASDIAYEKRSFGDVLKALKILTLPGGRVLLSEPSRELAKPFTRELEESKCIIRQEEMIIQMNSMQNKITVFELELNKI